ncbi:hypothetical protein SAMD00019534_112370, partial [Acytostelium subglobosum LB1]|uniref:hypothetical protein n=1 Tax=Acytostelium subglobosum LB1 TaxID=1410327 RepID=UPI000644FB85
RELEVVIYDHHPSLNPDFEYPLQHGDVTVGLVSQTLINGVPIFVGSPGQGAINNASTFSSWFVNTPGINMPIVDKLQLYPAPNDESKYTISNGNFFPIDNRGFDAIKNEDGTWKYQRYTDRWSQYSYNKQDALNGQYHNFHFCMHASATFDYKGTELFRFEGDDDVWVYINGQLVVDLGGIHQQANYTLDFSTIENIEKGDRCKFDFFYCERHTDRSEIKIETELDLYCSYRDYCGMCQGTGGSCCNPDRDCDDGDPCTKDLCPTDYKNDTLKNGKFGCQYQDMNCGKSDKCTINTCAKGQCQQKLVNCDDNDMCTEDHCDPVAGCTHIRKDCDDGNPCTLDTCTASSGQCQHQQIDNCTSCPCPQATKCDTFICHSSSSCSVTPKIISDDNMCTQDKCDAQTGEIKHTATQCESEDLCQVPSCDPESGQCILTPIDCDDSNACTLDSCSEGECVHSHFDCDDQDPCTVDSCKTDSSGSNSTCIHTPMVCKAANACEVAFCNASGVCSVKQLECPVSDTFCNVSACDVNAGCIMVPRACIPENAACQKGTCSEEKKQCEYRDFDPKPFKCQPIAVQGAVIGTAAIVGIALGAAAAVALAAYGGKKTYDYWKNQQNNKMQSTNQNPLYKDNPQSGTNPFYGN